MCRENETVTEAKMCIDFSKTKDAKGVEIPGFSMLKSASCPLSHLK